MGGIYLERMGMFVSSRPSAGPSFPLFRLWPDISLIELALTLQLGIVKTAGVAEGSCAVRTAPPFGGIDPVAAVAPSGRSRTL